MKAWSLIIIWFLCSPIASMDRSNDGFSGPDYKTLALANLLQRRPRYRSPEYYESTASPGLNKFVKPHVFALKERLPPEEFNQIVLDSIPDSFAKNILTVSAEHLTSEDIDSILEQLFNMQQAKENYSDRLQSSVANSVQDGLATGLQFVVAACICQVIYEPCVKVVKSIPTFFTVLKKFVCKINPFSRRQLHEPLTPVLLLQWEEILESILQALCNKEEVAHFMTKNKKYVVHKIDNDTDQHHWLFFTRYIHVIFDHIVHYLQNNKQFYYIEKAPSRSSIFFDAQKEQSHQDVCFMINLITQNLNHIKNVCSNAKKFDELDVYHIKQVFCTTMCLLKKLRGLVGGTHEEQSNELLQQMYYMMPYMQASDAILYN